ncbi:MAG: class I SAM-dependent methyltransferase [Erysipelotrichaceae bacterium]|nr:class I SAM-dependent methyltransferase [Erysipelotrichaceae bacterium]
MNAYKKFGYYYDEVMSQLNYDLWLEFIEEFLKPGDNVLDLACGTGTLCTMLKLKGFDAEGLDLSETILEIGREKMKVNHLNFPLHHADMTNFNLNKKFNMITCFFDSVNFLKDIKEVYKMFDCASAHLKDNGYFIIDIFSKELLNEYENNDIVEDYVTFKLDWKTKKTSPTSLKHTIKIIEGDDAFIENYYEYYYEIRQLQHRKFKLVKISGDFNDDLEDEDERILLVYQKL